MTRRIADAQILNSISSILTERGTPISFETIKNAVSNIIIDATDQDLADFLVNGNNEDAYLPNSYFLVNTANSTNLVGVNGDGSLYEVGVSGGGSYEKLHFIAGTVSTQEISDDVDNPSMFTGMTTMNTEGQVEISDVDGSVKNISGREIKECAGSISVNMDTLSGNSTLCIWSERSNDGVTWVPNHNSLRVLEVQSRTEGFTTCVSFIINWQNNEYVRMRAYRSSGNIQLTTSSITTNGETVVSPSVYWTLSELD